MLSTNSIRVTLCTIATLSTIVITTGCTTGAEVAAGSPVVGDPNPNGKVSGASCATGDDCRTGVCLAAACQSATNTDGVRNGDETDTDCGGEAGPPCSLGKGCASGQDCMSGVCDDFKCGAAPNTDCGGPGASPRCADGKSCKDATDCASNVCIGGTCRPVSDLDGIKDDGETDVDCGGPNPIKCADDKGCLSGVDCVSGACAEGTKTCAPPRIDDGIMNGGETDIDCGGPSAAKRCVQGQDCLIHSDCASNGCGFDQKCAAGATCTQLEGGQTCGPNEDMTKQADCCTRASVGAYSVDKYQITAGRMRAFLGRLDGKVRDWATTLPAAKWNQSWTAMLPNSIDGTPGELDNANTQLGPYFGKRSCQTGFHTGHTFWTPAVYGDTKDFSQNVLDTKSLNCVPWWLMAALCVYDGGHLLTEPELHAAYTNSGTTAYPWGARGTYTTSDQSNYAIGLWSYASPNPPIGAAQDPDGYLDVAFYVAPPGRRPLGYSSAGVTDLVGNLLEWVGDSERQFVWKGSFENHGREADSLEPPIDNDPYLVMRTDQIPWRWQDVVAPASDPENVNGYYAIGGRCGY